MEWSSDSGEIVTWVWADPQADDPDRPQESSYPISIHVDGRRLRGAEAKRWKQRIEAEFVTPRS